MLDGQDNNLPFISFSFLFFPFCFCFCFGDPPGMETSKTFQNLQRVEQRIEKQIIIIMIEIIRAMKIIILTLLLLLPLPKE